MGGDNRNTGSKKKNYQIHGYFSEEEYLEVKAYAEENCVDVSRLIRKLVMDKVRGIPMVTKIVAK